MAQSVLRARILELHGDDPTWIREVRDIDAPEQAFATFERARRKRVEGIVKQSRRNDSGKAVSGPVGEWVRDRLLPFFLRLGTRAQEHQYAFRVDWTQRYA